MQLLHMLLPEDGEMDLGDELLHLASKIAKTRYCKTTTTCCLFG